MDYIALIHKEKKSYGLSFPDFPGCISAGASVEEAMREGAEALSFHVEAMQADGLAIPKPRSVDDIKKKEKDIIWKGAIMATIRLVPPPGRIERVQATLDARLVAEIDAVCKNRSEFLASAARDRLNLMALVAAKHSNNAPLPSGRSKR